MFAAEGGKVAFCGRNVERGKQVQDHVVESGGEAIFVRADVRNATTANRSAYSAAKRGLVGLVPWPPTIIPTPRAASS
jgi:NADP-dependent 3-hydroxy acid dehydrogenase YdfG